ncbi:MAG TPA: NAD(P)/FAD-dependent oxidoreductase [Thermoplasmata archaeon]|nr:NAD(P)/FAD-dependent oxidoreductase [Thermoplasmata archaeon]
MRIVVVGNNVAGTTAAKALRDADTDAEIAIYSDEPTPYYARPKLIDLISGVVKEDEMLFFPREWYEKNRIKLYLGSKVERIDPKAKTINVSGTSEGYDRLVLANGASSFLPPLKGLPKENVFTLRTLDDAKRIMATARTAKEVVIIGGGLLGLETARALVSGFKGLRITVLEYAEHLLMRQLDHEGATILQRWIENGGTKVLTKSETEEVLGGAKVSGVKLKDGRTIPADLIIISAGARPNLELAKDAGLKINRGIVVDGSLRTSDPDIFALGDVAEFDGKTWGIIPPALDQARVAAKKILGQDAPDYKGTVPSNTLKVMGLDLASIGAVRSEHETAESAFEEIRAMSADGSVYRKFVLKDGRMIGAILLGTKKDVNKVSKLIKEGSPIDALRDRLSDPGFSFP